MELTKTLEDLRVRRELVDKAIDAIENLLHDGKRPRGRPRGSKTKLHADSKKADKAA